MFGNVKEIVMYATKHNGAESYEIILNFTWVVGGCCFHNSCRTTMSVQLLAIYAHKPLFGYTVCTQLLLSGNNFCLR